MKSVYILFLVMLVTRAEDHEDVDIDALLADKSKFHDFVTCFLETGPCKDITAAFKKDVPVAVLKGCERCTPAQKHIVNAFIVSFKKEPQHYEAFKKKYDPENVYLKRLEAAVEGF